MTQGPTCLELIERGARQHADRIAVIAEGQSLTFAQANTRANRLAHAMRSAGLAPHHRVALLANNGVHSVPLDFACVKANLNRVPLNARLSAAEHVRMLTEAQCGVLVFGPDLADRAAELKALKPDLACLGLGARLDDGDDLLAMAESMPTTAPEADVRPEDVIVTLYTSGTTGVLKAAQHTQGSYAAICRNILMNLFPAGPDDAMLHSASLIHASGTFVLPLWLRGARNVVLPGFSPASFLDAIAEHRVTAINLVPTMMQMLLEHPGLDAVDVSSLERIIYGASPMPRAVIQRAIARFGQERFWQYFGQTEVPLCIAVLRPEDHHGEQLRACGRPAADVEIRLVDENGADVASGETGEILVRSPSAAAGYFNAPELNAQTFDAEGWVHTRDVGLFDANGLLHLRDRTSDMIISGGYNIYPREVEDALITHPAVLEVAVVGLPDDKWVEAVTAVVVRRAGQDVSEAELTAHVAGAIASYKKPHRIVFADAIPKTAVGKLDRKTLKARLTAA
ncbi:class I adenylate-forming enzyme family protein [Caulobacter sp. RHG1]|uniref:class I adenylate-forming enzyme family protein n=1 Tax=Caulobacter sp. (strain RHG1) TaxID=2545762 RepID=UPI001557851F|nr:AMP-binding protein [Caulobacter sp. RHG1]NQE61960.1 Long-chain-fatty-acid--CoA ligase [Caulobacter sp. RHG1]